MDIRRTPPRRGRRRLVVALIASALVIGTTIGLRRLRAAAPTVERATIWIDAVKRGPMLREVQALARTGQTTFPAFVAVYRPGDPVPGDDPTLRQVLAECHTRLATLDAVGLHYLTLDRSSRAIA